MNAISTIVCYPGLLRFEHTEANIDDFMASLANAGVTHVQINHLPDLMHPEQLNQPDNVYLWFANFGPPLDLFASSTLNRGLYPEMYLERNRRSLVRFSQSAVRHGLKPMLYLCEPRFVPERFFLRHPTLRGPRVDNPNVSKTPLYALCTDLPEVQAHYREMMAAVMEVAPEVSMASIFTSDSGAGFDYNPETYAGSNGAGFNKGIPLAKRAVNFLSILLEEGQRHQPDFTVNLTSGFSPSERARILEQSPPGIVGSVYGLYDWEGGLEEMWGYHQAVWGAPKAKWNVRTLDRAAARQDRFDDMKNRFDVAAKGNRSPFLHAELPTTDYPRPLRYTPHPFETIRMVKAIAAIGATRIAAWGVVSPKELVPFDVNAAAMRIVNADIDADPEVVVSRLATECVGAELAPVLVEAWRRCNDAWCERPMWNHAGLPKQALPGPLVPNLRALEAQETAYYRTIGLEDMERIQGLGAFVPHEADERNRDYVIDELYNRRTLPGLENAWRSLDGAADGCSDAAAAALLRDQAEHIRFGWLNQRSHANWYEAGRYLAPGNEPRFQRTMQQIVDDELEVTAELIAMLDGRLDKFMRVYLSDFMTYELGPGFVDHLRCRMEVMRRHRDDSPVSLKGSLNKMHVYQKSLAEYDA